MFKSNRYQLIILTLLGLLLFACSDTTYLEEALLESEERAIQKATASALDLQEAILQIDAAATENAEKLSEEATRSAEILTEAQGAAQEEIASARATANAIAAQATADASILPPYDVDIYGVIDSLNISGITVPFWHQQTGSREEALINLITEFNTTNQFGIVIEPTNQGDIDDIFDKMNQGFLEDDIPGIVEATPYQAASYQRFEGLVSLEPYIENALYGLSDRDQADFIDSFEQENRLPQFDNDTFGVTLNRSMLLLYYNTSRLATLGVDAPPRSLVDFEEVACAATNSDNGLYGLNLSGSPDEMIAFIMANGGEIYNEAIDQYQFNTPEAESAMAMLQNLVREGCAILPTGTVDNLSDFAAGQTLFALDTTTNIPFYQSAIANNNALTATVPIDWSVAPLPYSGFEPVQYFDGVSLYIPQSSPEEQLAAWIFAQFMMFAESQTAWVEVSNELPLRSSTKLNLEEYIEDNPPFATALDLAQYGQGSPPIAKFDEVEQAIAAAYSAILAEEADLITILDTLENAANTILNSN